MASPKYIVKLIKAPAQNDYRQDFFPRYFAFKSDAVRLQMEIIRNGGEAMIVKKVK